MVFILIVSSSCFQKSLVFSTESEPIILLLFANRDTAFKKNLQTNKKTQNLFT